MRAKQSKENERASRRSYYMNSYYLFLLLVWVATFSVENSTESHKAVEIGHLLLLTIQEWEDTPQIQPDAKRPLRGR